MTSASFFDYSTMNSLHASGQVYVNDGILQLLVHASACDRLFDCPHNPFCMQLKQRIHHELVCQLPACIICNDINNITRRHSMTCNNEDCRVVKCVALRRFVSNNSQSAVNQAFNNACQSNDLLLQEYHHLQNMTRMNTFPKAPNHHNNFSNYDSYPAPEPFYQGFSINRPSPLSVSLPLSPTLSPPAFSPCLSKKRSIDGMTDSDCDSYYADSPMSRDSYDSSYGGMGVGVGATGLTSRSMDLNFAGMSIVNLPTRSSVSNSPHDHSLSTAAAISNNTASSSSSSRRRVKQPSPRNDPANMDVVARQKLKQKENLKAMKKLQARNKELAARHTTLRHSHSQSLDEDVSSVVSAVGVAQVEQHQEEGEEVAAIDTLPSFLHHNTNNNNNNNNNNNLSPSKMSYDYNNNINNLLNSSLTHHNPTLYMFPVGPHSTSTFTASSSLEEQQQSLLPPLRSSCYSPCSDLEFLPPHGGNHDDLEVDLMNLFQSPNPSPFPDHHQMMQDTTTYTNTTTMTTMTSSMNSLHSSCSSSNGGYYYYDSRSCAEDDEEEEDENEEAMKEDKNRELCYTDYEESAVTVDNNEPQHAAAAVVVLEQEHSLCFSPPHAANTIAIGHGNKRRRARGQTVVTVEDFWHPPSPPNHHHHHNNVAQWNNNNIGEDFYLLHELEDDELFQLLNE